MSATQVWFSSRWILPRKISRTPRQQPYCRVPALCSFQKAKCFPLLRVHSALQQEKLCARRTSKLSLVVGSSGLEPPTSRLSGVCSNQLSYEPISSARGRRPHRCGFRHDGCCRENSLAPRAYDYAAVRSVCAMQSFHFTQLRVHFTFLYRIALCATYLPIQSAGGDERNRTDDPLLAKQVLSQLSYTPIFN